jgi:hypothetical protein
MYTAITMMITYGVTAAGGPLIIAVGPSGITRIGTRSASIGTVIATGITIATIVTGGNDPTYE